VVKVVEDVGFIQRGLRSLYILKRKVFLNVLIILKYRFDEKILKSSNERNNALQIIMTGRISGECLSYLIKKGGVTKITYIV
jgi:hypothetical protein